jgi:hypothetical protein
MSNRQCSFLLIVLGFVTFCANENEPARGDQIEAVIGLAIMLAGVFVALPWTRTHPAKEADDGDRG